MHTASPRSKIIEHGPFHRKVAWKGRHADFSRSNPPPLTAPSSPALAIVQRVFPYCFPRCSPPTISRDSNVCNVYALHVPRFSDIRREQLGDAYEFKWMNDNNEICLWDDLDDSLIFFFFFRELGERVYRGKGYISIGGN